MRETKSAVAAPDRRAAPDPLFILLGVAYLLTTKPSFTATATLLVDGRGFAQLFQQQSNTIDMTAVQDQIAIFQSEDVARRIVTELHLAEDPEFAGESPLTRLRVLSNSLFGRRSLEADLAPYPRAILSFARRLTAKAVPASRAVDISFRSSSPERAARIANAVAEAAIASQLEARLQAAVAAGEWLDKQLAELRRKAEAAERELAELKGRSNVGTQPQLLKLESSAHAYRSEYDNLLRRNLEWTRQQQFPLAEARLISRASTEFERASPDAPMVLPLAAIAGVIAGFALALLRQMSDRTLRSAREVEAALDTDCIALIPNTGIRKLNLTPPITFNSGLTDLIQTNKVIGLASALPGEGRTTVALALARLLARTGRRTILVDCDLRNCQLSRALCPDQPGIVDVLVGGFPLEAAAWSDPDTGLMVLPAGSRTSADLTSPAVRNLFDRLRVDYDAVILDLPPLAPMCHAGVGPDLADGYVFVIEWGRTDVRVVEAALADPRFAYTSVAVRWLVGRRPHEAQARLASASGIPFFENSDAASPRKSR
jgi:polysaccharide biosynthesis transport protein